MAHTSTTRGFKTFQATAVAITAGKRVVLDSSGTIAAAGATDVGIGVVIEDVPASGYGTVQLWGGGTIQVCAHGAITRGATLFAAAAGRVDDSGSYSLGLQAVSAATAQDDIIEAIDCRGQVAVPAPFASADIGTIAAAGSAQNDATAITKIVQHVTAGDGTKGVVLPTASAGLVHYVYNASASALKVYPNTSDTIAGGSANAAVTMAARGTALFIAYDATDWMYVEPDQA